MAWILGSVWPSDPEAAFERAVKRRGAKYVFHLMDDWFSVPAMARYAHSRIPIADLVVTVTPELRERVLAHYPNCVVAVIEEPVDVDRLGKHAAAPLHRRDLPLVVWNGSPHSLQDLREIIDVLNAVYRQQAFKFRVICGVERPSLPVDFPWEWTPFRIEREADLMANAAVGLAPLADTVYARCKNTTKIKTYSAAGVPVVGSAWGHSRRTIVDGETGFLVKTPEDWGCALNRLLSDPLLSQRMGRAARERAVRAYSYGICGAQWAGVLADRFPWLKSGMATSAGLEI